jgi:opacity protein-like surface antigen
MVASRLVASFAAVLPSLLSPAVAFAEPSDDPTLHVDASVKDCSVRFASSLTQDAFHRFVREFGSVSAFKQGAPPVPLAAGDLVLSAEWMSFTVEEHAAAWNDTFTHPTAHHPLGAEKSFPKLHLRGGLTDRLEMGAFYTANPEANYGWAGIDLKYAILDQRAGEPVSLAVRGAYTKTLYVSDMNMHAVTADVSVGRTLWGVVTPYAGVGLDGVLALETSPAVRLEDEAASVAHAFTGVEVRYWRLTAGAELQVGALTNWQAQLGFVF